MTQRTDPRVISGAFSMIRLPSWGLKGNLALLVRLLTVDANADWAEISRKDAAHWLHTGPEQTRRMLEQLVHDRVLERRTGAGRRAAIYRLGDPFNWRGVPWRFRDRDPGDGLPELVRRRLEELAKPEPGVDRAVVVSFDAWGRPTKQLAVSGQARKRSSKLRSMNRPTPEEVQQPDPLLPLLTPEEMQQIDGGPSSTSREPTGSAVARDEEQKTEEAGCAGRGDRTLTGAAEEVRRAIVRTGTGPVKGKLLVRLDDGFRHVSVDLLGPVLGAIARAGADGQRPPALVDMAVDMIEAGAASVTPLITGKKPEVVLAELYDQEQVLKQELAAAEAEGSDVAGIFRRQLAACQDRIAQITGEEPTG